MNALEIRGLCKHYGTFSLTDVSFSLPMGAIVGLVGRNGAGKTTTLKSIINAVHPDAGEITVFGKPRSVAVMQDIGMVFDECCFSDVMTAQQLNKAFASIYQNWSMEMFTGLCERYQLPMNNKIKTFSRGMKQKLSIAAALSHSPKLLLLDEPTGGLDPVARGEILDDLQEFIEDGQHSVLLSTHITTDLDRVADRIVFISGGTVKLDEDKDTILEDFCILKGSPEQLSQVASTDILGLRRSTYAFEALCRGRTKMTQKYPQLTLDRADIEQIMVLMEGGSPR